MRLGRFIEKFVEPNTIIRLQYKIKGGHEEVPDGLMMEWTLKNTGFADREVIGVTDIAGHKTHSEAVNITIERK